MPRVSRDRQDRLGQLMSDVNRRYKGTPLNPVRELILDTLAMIRAAAQGLLITPEAVENFVIYTTEVLASLPSSFSERFTFDTQFLAGLVEDLSQGGCLFSPWLMPKPSSIWGHQTVVPSPDKHKGFFIDVIHIPGDDTLEDIDLRDYPFACHELGHNVLFNKGGAFATAFAASLDSVIGGLQRQMLSLQGTGRQIAEITIEQIRRYWTPTSDHSNWAHEIAVDVIAAWVCGPAYLAAFHFVLERDQPDPFLLGQTHPPYEVRSRAMIDAVNQSGWAYYTPGLQNLVDRWPRSAWAIGRTNLYAACADARLVTSCVAAALDTCRALGLPQCTPTMVDIARAKLAQKERPDNGIETLLSAWALGQQADEATYIEWERDVIRGLLDSITE